MHKKSHYRMRQVVEMNWIAYSYSRLRTPPKLVGCAWYLHVISLEDKCICMYKLLLSWF